jgi:hypothetical protein
VVTKKNAVDQGLPTNLFFYFQNNFRNPSFASSSHSTADPSRTSVLNIIAAFIRVSSPADPSRKSASAFTCGAGASRFPAQIPLQCRQYAQWLYTETFPSAHGTVTRFFFASLSNWSVFITRRYSNIRYHNIDTKFSPEKALLSIKIF